MSFNPEALVSRDDPLLPRFTVPFNLDDMTRFRIDTGQRFFAYYTGVVIRNNSPNFLMHYRGGQSADFQSVPALSERTFPGWGKYFEVAAGTNQQLVGAVEFDLVKVADALRGVQNG